MKRLFVILLIFGCGVSYAQRVNDLRGRQLKVDSLNFGIGLPVGPLQDSLAIYRTAINSLLGIHGTADTAASSYWAHAGRFGAGTVRSSAGGVFSATASDTVGLGASLAVKGTSNYRGWYTNGGPLVTDTLRFLKPTSMVFTQSGSTLALYPDTSVGEIATKSDTITARTYSDAKYAPKASPTFTGVWTGSASMRGTATFSTTATRVATFVSGTAATDIVIVTPTGSSVVTTTNLTVQAKTDSIIIFRGAAGTSGAVMNWIRLK